MLAKPHEDLVNVCTEISANDKTYEITAAFKPIIDIMTVVERLIIGKLG